MGEVFTHELWYEPGKSMRTLHVYLPDGYGDGDERYPVMYFFDGHNLFFDEWATFGKSWGLKDFLDGWEKPLIIVGMECSHVGDERLAEYCPYSGRKFGYSIEGIGEQTFQWIVNEVKPWADANLRTWGHREATAIGGSSMGGLMSLYGVVAHNDVFSKAASLSTGVRYWKQQLQRELRAAQIAADTRVYLSWGEYEAGRMRKGADPATESPEAKAELDYAERLRKAGADVSVFFQEGGEHNEASWELQNGRYMDYLWLDE